MDRKALESLDSEILIDIAKKRKIKVRDDISRESLIEQILDDCNDRREELDDIENAPMRVEQRKYDVLIDEELYNNLEEKKLPDLKGESFFRLLIRDPVWAFCYWNVKDTILEELLSNEDFSGFFLKVYQYKKNDKDSSLDSYVIPVSTDDDSYYFSIVQGYSYQVSLVTQEMDKENVILTSNIIDVPSVQIKPKNDNDFNLDSDILISLSAIDTREEFLAIQSPFESSSSFSSVDFYITGD
ncbi:DUF4912 domain-containing protein [Spirochaetia bacterium 38H-sp]|uniref:DUF4912 domain-containing protein n=1 Tax=Rarispira pelagica TaxID=3141764 RepID=A0ABU9UFC6_9SPIR